MSLRLSTARAVDRQESCLCSTSRDKLTNSMVSNFLDFTAVVQDSLLATPLIIDLVLLAELATRVYYKTDSMAEYSQMHPVLSILSYLLKAPLVPEGTEVINALFKQRACIENIFRALLGLQPENDMRLEQKLKPNTVVSDHLAKHL